MKHQSQINLDVELTFEIVPPERMGNEILPVMVDIQSAYVSLEKPDGKTARVNVLKVLDESQLLLLEDEIIESLLGDE